MTGSVLDAPHGIGAETVAASVVLCVVATITVILRVYVRIRIGALGRDDYSMVIALAFFIPCCVISILGCFSGFGASEELIQELDPSGGLYRNGRKYFFIFWIAYLACLPFIKLSICFALLRIADSKRYVIPLWLIFGFTVLMSGVGFVALMTQCHPISASFDPTPEKCSGGSGSRIGAVTITLSVFSMLTDWMYAAIPIFIIWNLNMKFKVKASLAFLLALGALASVSTIVRMPYTVKYFFEATHTLRKTASIIIWSIVEAGIGIIAGSLPPLRPLFRRVGFGFGATRRLKLTYEVSPPAEPHGGSSSRSDGVDGKSRAAVGCAQHQPSVRLKNVAKAKTKTKTKTRTGRGNSLTTTCRGGVGEDRRESWDCSTLEEETGDVSSQKLVIMKNTQIDIEFEPADRMSLPPGK
ncbi:hypothetical protein F4818DRAFT_455292 [Hypoxylon cercidicola]|nr:hypothetical protein F4818DRAFT_455292 [Hypoxylon cercidicola]